MIDYNQLDPGIRDIVRALRDAGWCTSDSGDGVSKLDPDGDNYQPDALPVPHVVVLVTKRKMLEDADRIMRDLPAGWEVEACYHVSSGVAYLMCTGGQ